MPYKPLALLLLCAGVLIGCTAYSAHQGLSTHRPDKVAQYFYYLSNLPSEELMDEFKKAKAAYDNHQNDATALRLALLFILPQPELNDDLQAVHMLKSLLRSEQESTDSTMHFVFLLTYLVEEIHNKEVLHEHANYKLKEQIKKNQEFGMIYNETKKKLNAQIKKNKQQELLYKETEQSLRGKEQLIDHLEQQIEQLKAIEKYFNRRRHVKPPST
jgi:hypothetical protein